MDTQADGDCRRVDHVSSENSTENAIQLINNSISSVPSESSITEGVPDSSPGKEAIKKLFHKELKVVLLDDRVVIGSFFCTDSDCNIVLGGAREYENEADLLSGKQEPRFIGLVMVAKKNVKGLFVNVKDDDVQHA